MKLEITLVIAAAAVLLHIWIAMRVGQVRTATKISVGDGGDERLQRRMRAHANFVENTPFFLILLAVIELARGADIWLWLVAILFILGRIAHVFGMDGVGRLRMIGTVTSMVILLGLAVYAVVIAYSGGFAGYPAPPVAAG